MLYFCFYLARSICNKNYFPSGDQYSDSDSDFPLVMNADSPLSAHVLLD